MEASGNAGKRRRPNVFYSFSAYRHAKDLLASFAETVMTVLSPSFLMLGVPCWKSITEDTSFNGTARSDATLLPAWATSRNRSILSGFVSRMKYSPQRKLSGKFSSSLRGTSFFSCSVTVGVRGFSSAVACENAVTKSKNKTRNAFMLFSLLGILLN